MSKSYVTVADCASELKRVVERRKLENENAMIPVLPEQSSLEYALPP